MKFSAIFITLYIVVFFEFIVGDEINNIISTDSERETISTLLECTKNENVDCVLSAVENGENMSTSNTNGWTAAMFAVSSGNLEILRVLIDRGIDLNLQDNQGYTPLMLAALEVCIFLLIICYSCLYIYIHFLVYIFIE
jgi:ankyrin repeat protein